MRITISEFRNGYKKVLEALHNGEVVEFPDGLQISKLVGPANSANSENINSANNLLTMSDEDIERVAERFADLIVPKLNTHNNGDLNNSKESDFKERREEAILKAVEIRPEFPVLNCGVCQRPANMPVEVEESKLWGDNGREGWVVVCKACTLGNPSRPYRPQEEVELEIYDTGFKMNERATTMNSGSNPIPKPIKKKKKI